MLKRLFSRKKATPKEQKPTAALATVQPSSITDWTSQIEQATGKARTQLLNQLTEKVGQGEFTNNDVKTQLKDLPLLMFLLQQDQPVADVTESQWNELTLRGYTSKVRKLAAAEIKNEALLATLVKETKGKDKAVYRILHEKLDRVHYEKRQIEDGLKKQQAILEAMERLAGGPFEPMYEAKFKGLIEQWKDQRNIEDSVQTSFINAQQLASEKIELSRADEPVEEIEEEVVPEEKPVAASRQPLIDSLVSKLLEYIATPDFSESAVSEAQHFLTDVQHQWRESEAVSKADKAEQRAFHKASTAFEVGLPKLQSLLEKHGDFPSIASKLQAAEEGVDHILHDVDDWMHEVEYVLKVELPESIQQIKGALDKYQQNLEEHRQKEISQVRYLRGQLRRCLSAVEDGSLRRASGLYHGIEEKLEGFDLTHHAGIRKQIDETTEALEKLRDWQSYAVLPKKEALIKRMSAMVEQSIDPESRAQTIRDMQDEWKLLSRGLQNRQQDLWETFHELAQKAYEPCKEFFSEQRHLREVNLNKRKEVVDQLNQYRDMVDWENPDIKEIDRVLQVARNDWRKYSPVDRMANKHVQTKFDNAHKALFDQLRKEQDVFKDNKQRIIEKAKALLELEDARDATEQAKKLQNEWKAAGIVARRDEQELWKSFRAVCDQLFERREQQVTAFKADLEDHKEKAQALIASMAKIASSETVLAEKSAFDELKTQYEQLGTLPKAHYQKLTKEYRDACGLFERNCKTARVSKADQSWQDLFEWVKNTRYSDDSAEDLEQTWQQLSVPEVAKKLVEAIPAWKLGADELNQAAMHEKTIDLEILTETESPAEDSAIRMNLQVQRLSDGIGSSTSNKDIDRLVVDWLAVGAVEKSAYDVFEERMKLARKTWLK